MVWRGRRLKHLLESERTEKVLDGGLVVSTGGLGEERDGGEVLSDDEGATRIIGG